MGSKSSLGKCLVKCLNLNTILDCQNEECFLFFLLQWFITQVYRTPNIIFFTSSKQLAIFCFLLFLIVYSTLKHFQIK